MRVGPIKDATIDDLLVLRLAPEVALNRAFIVLLRQNIVFEELVEALARQFVHFMTFQATLNHFSIAQKLCIVRCKVGIQYYGELSRPLEHKVNQLITLALLQLLAAALSKTARLMLGLLLDRARPVLNQADDNFLIKEQAGLVKDALEEDKAEIC